MDDAVKIKLRSNVCKSHVDELCLTVLRWARPLAPNAGVTSSIAPQDSVTSVLVFKLKLHAQQAEPRLREERSPAPLQRALNC